MPDHSVSRTAVAVLNHHAECRAVIEDLRHPGERENGPHFGGQTQHLPIEMIEQRPDAEAVSC